MPLSASRSFRSMNLLFVLHTCTHVHVPSILRQMYQIIPTCKPYYSMDLLFSLAYSGTWNDLPGKWGHHSLSYQFVLAHDPWMFPWHELHMRKDSLCWGETQHKLRHTVCGVHVISFSVTCIICSPKNIEHAWRWLYIVTMHGIGKRDQTW